MNEDKPRSRIRDDILTMRQWLLDGREKLRRQHDEGTPGIQICAQLTDLMDSLTLEVYEAALARLGTQGAEIGSHIVLMPHGGYGRREMAPYSDVDLMLLRTAGPEAPVKRLAEQLVQDFSDLGVELGFSLRTLRDVRQMSLHDPVVFTSLVDARFLGGSVRIYRRFVKMFGNLARWNGYALTAMVEKARLEERTKYGETVYLLEPNIKRSRGGMRDLQLVRWIGFARYGQCEPENLQRSGFLSANDYRSLRRAQSFLLRLRNELHFHAGGSHDVLQRDDQIRIAALHNYPIDGGLLPVELFMQEYFDHTSTVRQIVGHFIEGARWRYPRLRRFLSSLSSHRVGDDFRAGPTYITATDQGLQKVRTHLVDVLRLMELSSRYNCRIDHPTWQAIRQAMMSRDDLVVDQATAQRFLSFLSQTNQLGRQLRRLHELRVLGKLVPGFERARCLLQFNEYHKYTVDEHSIRAVELATEFAAADTVLGQAYRQIKEKHLVHLALLVHDLGKGYTEDHSEVGARLALKVAETLFLNESDTETLRYLVHRHLMMSHLAFRRDTSDESIVLQHAAEIGSPSMLRMMFVLTCADLAAVGPGTLNQWKQDVLSQLYLRMMDHLSGGMSSSASTRWTQRKEQLIQDPRCNKDLNWFERQIQALPGAYLDGRSADTILDDLQRLHELPRGQATAWGRFIPERNAVEYSVGVYEETVSGIFHRLTGALTGQGLEILAAEIHSLADRLCLDRFYVQDNDYRGQPPAERHAAVSGALVRSLTEPPETLPTYRRTWNNRTRSITRPLTDLPTRIQVDNTTSDACTIIDVFAHDRPGLLYTIARTLFELQLSVTTARIGTYLDQVVDVFYVVDQSGRKVQHDERIQQIRDALLAAIEQWEQTVHCSRT